MRGRKYRSCLLFLLAAGFIVLGYFLIAQADEGKPQYNLIPLFAAGANPAATFDDSIIAGLILDDSADVPNIIAPVANGSLVALNSETGEVEWRLDIPKEKHQQIQLIATPVKTGNKLVVIFQVIEKGVRTSHRLAVADLIARRWDESFPVLELAAQKKTSDGQNTVKFNPPTAYSHAALKHAVKQDSEWGLVYAGFGNANDTQPFHGWLFEIDMDAWRRQKKEGVISGVLLTTPEAECPVSVEYGTQEMICGGGVWSPAGPQIYPSNEGYELFVATGNGQVDLERQDFANSLLRLGPGLQFDPACNVDFCQNFNPAQPDEACLASCKNLFIPRLPKDNAPLKPAGHDCDSRTFAECLAWMDYDLGGSSPVKAKLKNGHEVLVQPGKDGAIYLIDASHLGTQFDRLQIAGLCGTAVDPCKASWMGMIVTRPALAYLSSDPVVIIPTFIPDNSHPAGVIAVKIELKNGRPKFKPLWRYPEAKSPKATSRFRSHPSLPVISKLGKNNEDIVWVIEVGNPAILYGLRIKDGAVVLEQPLRGAGRQLSAPIIFQDRIYLASSNANTGQAFVEAYRITSVTD